MDEIKKNFSWEGKKFSITSHTEFKNAYLTLLLKFQKLIVKKNIEKIH